MVRASGRQCQSRNSPGFDPSIFRHSGLWGAADEAVLKNVHKRKKSKKSPKLITSSSLLNAENVASLSGLEKDYEPVAFRHQPQQQLSQYSPQQKPLLHQQQQPQPQHFMQPQQKMNMPSHQHLQQLHSLQQQHQQQQHLLIQQQQQQQKLQQQQMLIPPPPPMKPRLSSIDESARLIKRPPPLPPKPSRGLQPPPPLGRPNSAHSADQAYNVSFV